MRSRNLKPGFFKNEHLARLPFSTRLLFQGLWLLADREGRLEDRPARIKAEVFPYELQVKVEAGLSALEQAGFIRRYQAGLLGYIEILHFSKHQHPHVKEPQSTIPAPELPGAEPDKTGAEHHTRTGAARRSPDSPSLDSPSLDSGERESGASTGKTGRFAPPAQEELEEFWASEGLRGDPGKFLDHFRSNGWRVSGKAPMRDWKAAARNWSRNEEERAGRGGLEKVRDRLAREYADANRPKAAS